MKKMRTLLVDNSACLREALRAFLLTLPRIELVGCAATANAALAQAERLEPDLVVMDVNMPDMSGFEILRRMRRLASPPQVVLISLYDDPIYHDYARRGGALALVAKTRVVTELPPVLDRLAADPVSGMPEAGGPPLGALRCAPALGDAV